MATISSTSEESAADGREGLNLEGPRWAHVGHWDQGTLRLHISPPRKGYSQQIFGKKAIQHRHPYTPAATALTHRGVSTVPRVAVQHRPSVRAQQLPPAAHPSSQHGEPLKSFHGF